MTKGKHKTMLDIREVIHRLRQGHSDRHICRAIKIDRSIIKKIRSLSVLHQWLDNSKPIPTDEEISKFWNTDYKSCKSHALDPYRDKLEQWNKEGNSAVVIHQLIKDSCPCDVQAVRRYLKKHFPKEIDPIMVRNTISGHDLDIDFGYLGIFFDDEGNLRKAWVFSFRLRHSRRAYRCVVLNQNSETFFISHIHAFEWFGGVPKTVILDNCKAAIIQSTIDNDMVRRSYQELAEHYRFIISPCLPRTPEHKGGVEGDVKYIKRNFLPTFLARQKERNVTTPYLKDLIEALAIWNKEVADIHIVHGIGRSPLEIFESEELKSLKPLPQNRWELTSWSQATVHKDWRVMYDTAYYSVPFQLIGKTVQICATSSLIRIFYDHKEVAYHEKAKKKWEYKRKSEYAPPIHENVLQCSSEGILSLAQVVGDFTYKVVNEILSHPTIDKLRPARLLLNLANKYSKERLEKACKRAFNYKAYSYSSVKNILEHNLDGIPVEENSNKVVPIQQFRFARNFDDYKTAAYPESKVFAGELKEAYSCSKHGNGMCKSHMDMVIADQIMEEELNQNE